MAYHSAPRPCDSQVTPGSGPQHWLPSGGSEPASAGKSDHHAAHKRFQLSKPHEYHSERKITL